MVQATSSVLGLFGQTAYLIVIQLIVFIMMAELRSNVGCDNL